MEFKILFHRGWMFQDALYILVQTLISNIKNITIKPLLSEFLKAFSFLSVLEEIASTVTKVWLQDKPALGIGCRCVTSKCVGVHQHRTPTVFSLESIYQLPSLFHGPPPIHSSSVWDLICLFPSVIRSSMMLTKCKYKPIM